jgi:SSS family solute:Na+ symporter
MSIAAAHLFTRNIYKEYIRKQADDAEQSLVARISSLFVKGGALIFVIALPTRYAIDLQLLGGVWILQTLPAIVFGLWTHWLHKWAVLAGWLAGMIAGTWMAIELEFETSVYELDLFGWTINAYEGVIALVLNLIIAVAGTLLLSSLGVRRGPDETEPEHYQEPGERRDEGAVTTPVT